MLLSVLLVLELVALLWLALPFLVGGAAVAEERKLGTLEGFLCLPVRRRREFVVKFGMALTLGIFLGAVMPWFMERIGSLLGLSSRGGFGGEFWLHQDSALDSAFVCGAAALVAAGITLLSFYASSLTRNLLQALGLAVIFSVAAALISSAVVTLGHSRFDLLPLWSGPLAGCILLPVMSATILLLAYGNFKQAQVSAKLWFGNVSRMVCLLLVGAIVTSLIYHRVWENWIPEEPPHGAAAPSIAKRRMENASVRLIGTIKMESSRARPTNGVGFPRSTSSIGWSSAWAPATRGRTGLARLLLGSSMAERVIRRAPCPVLAYRAPQPPQVADHNGQRNEQRPPHDAAPFAHPCRAHAVKVKATDPERSHQNDPANAAGSATLPTNCGARGDSLGRPGSLRWRLSSRHK